MINAIVSGTADAAASQSAQSVSDKAGLGKVAFLSLLITQMRFQDPMKPLEDREFIAQLAQFSSLEQMQQVNANLSLLAQMNAISQAAALIGRQISATKSDTGETVSGRVEAALFEEGQPWLMVGQTKVNPSDVTRVEP